MNDMWKIMQDFERSMEKIQRRIFSDFNHMFPVNYPDSFLHSFDNDGDIKVKTFRFYARREMDGTGRDVQEAYMEMNGEKKYWKKDGNREILIEPKQSSDKADGWFDKFRRKLLPGDEER
ncbi:MAG: hypothetical protein H0Z40_02285 [Desulfotomaculum sp.]|nr:hypothetical protein [Desulfotomaculum sp.]